MYNCTYSPFSVLHWPSDHVAFLSSTFCLFLCFLHFLFGSLFPPLSVWSFLSSTFSLVLSFLLFPFDSFFPPFPFGAFFALLSVCSLFSVLSLVLPVLYFALCFQVLSALFFNLTFCFVFLFCSFRPVHLRIISALFILSSTFCSCYISLYFLSCVFFPVLSALLLFPLIFVLSPYF